MNKRKAIIIILSWLFVLITMIIISSFSMQNGEASKETSDGIVEVIVEQLPNKDQITIEQKDNIRFSVRKLAHFSIYTVLGFSLFNAIKNSFKIKAIFCALSSVVSSSLFAIIDEFLIQGHSDGRSPQWTDVLIDSFGAIIGVLLFVCIILIYNKVKDKNKTKNGIL